VFEFALEAGYVKYNPTPSIKFKEVDKVKKVLTEVQASILLNKAKEHDNEWYPVWCVAVYCGLRSGELFALQWDRVDLENRTIKVDSSWNNKDGFKSTKTGDERIVEIAPSLLVVLKQLKLQSHDSMFVLPRLQKWKDGNQAEELQRFLFNIRLPQVKFHDLRATWATIMLGKGIEPIK